MARREPFTWAEICERAAKRKAVPLPSAEAFDNLAREAGVPAEDRAGFISA